MTPDEAKSRAIRLLDLISGPLASSIYSTHPNTLGALLLDERTRLVPAPPYWDDWWRWSGSREDSWSTLVKINNDTDGFGSCGSDAGDHVENQSDVDGVPESLIRLLLDVRTLSLPRRPDPMSLRNSLCITRIGMSPKKYHEVFRMASFVLDLLDTLREQRNTEVRHVVDIGAGQGYLSRVLCDLGNLHVLALDSSRQQVENSSRKPQESNCKGSLTYRTIWLGEGPAFGSHPGLQGSELENRTALEEVIGEWIVKFVKEGNKRTTEGENRKIPVVFVALHACGSLTPSILREVLDHRQSQTSAGGTWFVSAAVVVGCCYNLMRKEDFPLSQTLRSHPKDYFPEFELSPSHLQLAAQVPSQWFRSTESALATELAMKKVLYRALITPFLSHTDNDKASQKLGKLNSRAYESFESFLSWAGRKIGADLDLLSSFKDAVIQDPNAAEKSQLSRRIKTLHALRCLLGPPVESLIILDRYLWLNEELDGDEGLNANIINIFDQETGSGRNVALVVAPS